MCSIMISMNDTTKARKQPSGRFVLRIDPHVHAALRAAAEAAGMSLNEYCARALAATSTNLGARPAAAAVERAAQMFGAALVGVAVFGSWARDEMSDTSDVDLLVVLDGTVSITRALYRRWDEAPLSWEGRPLEPQFVNIDGSARRPAGMWAEVAVDGVVLFERGFQLSKRLVRLRRDIAAGRLVRRVVSGQSYWVEAA